MAEQYNKREANTQLPPAVMAIIAQAVQSIGHGTVVIIVQDLTIVQVEKHEKIRIGIKGANEMVITPLSQAELAALKKHVGEAVTGLKYGQVTLLVRNGRVMQVEKTEKLRLPDVEGRFGDGI